MQEIMFDDLRRGANRAAEIMLIRAFMAAGEPKHEPDTPFKVIFNINGSDVDFPEFCKEFYNQYDECLVSAATELLKEKTNLRQVTETIDAFTRTIEEKLKEMASSLLNVPPEIAAKMVDENRY